MQDFKGGAGRIALRITGSKLADPQSAQQTNVISTKERNGQPNAIFEGDKLSVPLSVSLTVSLAVSLEIKALTASFPPRNMANTRLNAISPILSTNERDLNY